MHTRRPRRMPRNPRRGGHNKVDNVSSSSTTTQEPTPMVAPPPGFAYGPSSSTYYTLMLSAFQTTTMPTTTYRQSMLCRKHFRNHHSTKLHYPQNHLFLDRRIHDGNQGATNRNQLQTRRKRLEAETTTCTGG
ncbi:hypothetical protein GOBAR_AA07852 [Gossypium barbadense]|uniref:Uncharacterized protein n=1 Tax=Gossypium barbadense TaxID=3634 RepID=A0A2P5YB47_GOSBA|nr:hypothetical protein GOBAR_AA07852 [Gossypium barbadense]